eukprot:GHUV01006760.1.p1 GENE.GHUV01006760.1~~GHUV01006760.1.p1  ORF type:complete len:265 (+),score=51.86 GHUV01006760.1:1005-1799(+)
MCNRLKDLEAVSDVLISGSALSNRPSEACSNIGQEAVGLLSSSRGCDSPYASSQACGSGPVADWQQPLSWRQLTYVPVLSSRTPEQCEDSGNRSNNCLGPSQDECDVTTASAFNVACALLVPCCGGAPSQLGDNQQVQNANKSKQWVSNTASMVAAQGPYGAGLNVRVLGHVGAAKSAVPDTHQKYVDSCDDELVLDANAFAELQDKVAAAQLKAMFGAPASGAASSYAAAAVSGQELDSLAVVRLEVPYKQVSGVGLCYVGGY